jgi:merlin
MPWCNLNWTIDLKLGFTFHFRVEYLTKSKQVQNQLRELRSEIELLKLDENVCPLDDISAEQIRMGETKYSTLRKVKSGSTKARVAFFEEL